MASTSLEFHFISTELYQDFPSLVLIPYSKAGHSTMTQFERVQPRQLSALVFKSVTIQKRQWFMNVCCISLCPVLMVVMAGSLAAFVTRLLDTNFVPLEYLYCSNVSAMTNISVPVLNILDSRIPFANSTGIGASSLPYIRHANYFVYTLQNKYKVTGATALSARYPCVFQFGESYPQADPYQRPSNTTTWPVDTSYMPQPTNGWFFALTARYSATSMDSRVINLFSTYQHRTAMLYTRHNSVDSALLGSKLYQGPIAPVAFRTLNFSQGNLPFVSPRNVPTAGILGTLPTRYWMEINTTANNFVVPTAYWPVPYYNETVADPDSMDDILGALINDAVSAVAAVDKRVLLRLNPNPALVNQLYAQIAALLSGLPHGSVHFQKIDHAAKNYSWLYQIGSDARIAAASNFPSAGHRTLVQQTLLDNAILRTSNATSYGSASISHGLRIFPTVGSNRIDYPFAGLIGAILYPFGVSFLLPLFTIALVREKEERIFVMMRMNGMRPWAHYMTHYVTFFVLASISSLLFFLAGLISRMSLFSRTETGLLILVLLLWGNVQTSLAFFFGSMFNKSRNALIVSFIIVLCGVIISSAVDQMFLEYPCPSAYFIWPPFAFYRALALMNRASYVADLRPYRFRTVVPGDELFTAIMFLFVEMFVYMIISIYLTYVLPSEFGTSKPWHFPVTDTIQYFQKRARRKMQPFDSEMMLAMNVKLDKSDLALEDADVKQERTRIDEGKYNPDCPLVIKHMRKIYRGRYGTKPKLAVKDVTFAVERGIVFGLLGPNGAGKTTLISILTGLYPPSSGEASLNGFDVKLDTDKVYRSIGICPQFDILWEDMNVEEHLRFYARLKGIKKEEEQAAIDKALAGVSLTVLKHRLSTALSGGEKRRLSIAIALLGDPPVIFLDEPTTGLDPEVRRLIWNIVNESREGKTIVLTTHSMEEAEALCQRIGIMAKGTLRCLANPIRLKQLYGSGFKAFFNSKEEDTERAVSYVESVLPSGFKKVDAFATSTTYEFPRHESALADLFNEIELHKKENGIQDWGVGQTTLEEVFVRLISETDASHE